MRIAVIGAGVAGLTAAHRLTRSGHHADVYERWPGLGGQAATLDVGGGHRLERYYHHLFSTDRDIVALHGELGLADAIEWHESSVAVFAGEIQHPFVTAGDLLRFAPLPLPDRVRLGAAALALQRLGPDPRRFEGVTARAWIERVMGRAAWDVVWGPLLRGKFGARADDVAMVWLASKLALRRPMRGDQARGERLGYPRASFQPLFERLADRIAAGPGRVLTDRPAACIARAGDGRLAVTPGAPGSFRHGHDPRAFPAAGAAVPYDRVLVTVPGDGFARLLDAALEAEVGPQYVARVCGVDHCAALCLLLELDRPFSRFYWTNIAAPGLPFVGLIEHTNLVGAERYDGRRFLYVANYLPRGHPLLALGAGELLAAYTPGLRRVNPGFTPGWVRNAWRFAEPAAQPVVTIGYRERMPPLATGAPGLVLANTMQVYPEDRGTNYAVRLGERAAAVILAA